MFGSMKRIAVRIVVYSLPLILVEAAMGQTLPSEYQEIYTGLREATADPNRGTMVRNFTIRHDAATLRLDEGQLHLLKPIGTRTFGAVFVGRGQFSVRSPIGVEARQIERIFEMDSLDVPIKTAVLFFSAEFVTQLFGDIQWQSASPPSNMRREIEETMDYLSDDDGWISRDLLLPFLNDAPGFFYAHVAESRGEPLMFSVNPYEFEEVSLARRSKVRGIKVREVVSQFHWVSDYESGTSTPQEALDLVRVASYEIENDVASNMDLSARATATVTRLASDHDWVPFRLYAELDVDSIVWGNGTPAVWARGKEEEDLWVNFSTAPADTAALTFFYQGELFERYRDLWIEVRSPSTWFPVYEYVRPITYRMTFRVPERYTVSSVGYRVSETTADGVVTTVWETPMVRQVSFNIGDFEEHEIEDPRIPRLRIQYDEGAHRAVRGMADDANLFLLEQRDMPEQVGADLANAFAFFTDVFGPSPVAEFTATEIPGSHGMAFPGLVLLSWWTFQWTSEKGYDEMFRAHEVAHQWWGIGVEPATYHDRWLSEGFSEFSGLWYMGRVLGSVELFTRRLKETREALLDRREEMAPIWLGTRARNSEHASDYQSVVYHKGAWVLHMLRNMLVDLDTGDDQAFRDMMRDFYTNNFGQQVSTHQFMAVVNEHFGGDMDWFFEQWVYGTAIPRYNFSYKVDELESGDYRATVRVRQEWVPDHFRMYVPILVDFGDEGSALVRIEVTGPVTEVELPLLPMVPRNIEINPHEAVLADVRTERWKG